MHRYLAAVVVYVNILRAGHLAPFLIIIFSIIVICINVYVYMDILVFTEEHTSVVSNANLWFQVFSS